VYSIATIILSYFVGFLAFFLLSIGLSYCNRIREEADGEEEGMEMVPIEVNKDGETKEDDLPLEGLSETSGDARTSDESGCETPLPVYSVDGAGR
jgi:hypothetical protein